MKFKKWGRSEDPMKNWPVGDDGEPVAPALLCQLSAKERDYGVIVNMLGAYGVPVMTSYPGDGGLGKVVLGVPGYGVQLFVPETMLELAQDLTNEQAQFLDDEG